MSQSLVVTPILLLLKPPDLPRPRLVPNGWAQRDAPRGVSGATSQAVENREGARRPHNGSSQCAAWTQWSDSMTERSEAGKCDFGARAVIPLETPPLLHRLSGSISSTSKDGQRSSLD